jgi:Zn-dependent protease with chaperone function
MNNLPGTSQSFDTTLEKKEQTLTTKPSINMWKKLRGGFFIVLGYLLSPLCWWNDLLFNLPIAYSFGYLCSFLSPKLLFPCTIIGYWLSNIIGILMMQFGSGDIFQTEPKERNLKKELFNTLVSSTVYTLVIMFLIQFKVIDTPLAILNNS